VTKKKYYEKMDTYAKLAEQYQHNAQYVNEEDFSHIRKQLNQQIENFLQQAETEYSVYGQTNLLKYRDRLMCIQSKINNREYLSRDDYANTYFEEHWFVFFTRKQVFVILIVCFIVASILELVT